MFTETGQMYFFCRYFLTCWVLFNLILPTMDVMFKLDSVSGRNLFTVSLNNRLHDYLDLLSKLRNFPGRITDNEAKV
jgi:hypothetical protein